MAFIDLNPHSVATKLKVKAEKCYGLCTGSYLKGSDPFSRPDMNRIVRCLQRLSQDLGLNDHLIALVVASAAGNIDSLRSLGIYFATGVLQGTAQSKKPSLLMVKRRGLIRGLCGVITGEVKGELLQFCRVAPDGERYNTNIDMLCYELLDGIVPANKLRIHANHLRCVAGLSLADGLLLNATRTLVRGSRHLTFLVPNSGRIPDKTTQSIAQIFEELVIKQTQYRCLMEGIMNLRLPPDELEKIAQSGDSNLTKRDSWIGYVVDDDLWDADGKWSASTQHRNRGNGTFSNLVAQIILTFSGNSVALQKKHGLVALMEVLRPDHVPKGLEADQRFSTWKLLERMAADKIGRANDDVREIASFAWLMRRCYEGGIESVNPSVFISHRKRTVTRQGARGAASKLELKLETKDGVGVGATVQVAVDDSIEISLSGCGYKEGDKVLLRAGGDHPQTLEVESTSALVLSDTLLECMLHLVACNWPRQHCMESDVVDCQLNVDPARAVRQDINRAPRETPGWKLLRESNSRSIPNLVVGGGRRPLLALRRLRAFINLGTRTLDRVPLSQYGKPLKTMGEPRVYQKCSTINTEIFALYEGTCIGFAYKVAVLALVHVLDHDMDGMEGLWASSPALVTTVFGQLVKRAIDAANSERLGKRSKQAVGRYRKEQLQKAAPRMEDVAAQVLESIAQKQHKTEATVINPKELDPEEVARQRKAEKWEVIRFLVEHVLQEFKFDTAFATDPTLNRRRVTLRKMLFEEVPGWGEMVQTLDPLDPSTAQDVLAQAFDAIGERGHLLLTGMLAGEDDAVAACEALVKPLCTPNIDATRTNEELQASFVSLLEGVVRLMQIRTGDEVDQILDDFTADFRNMQTITPLGERLKAFPRKETIGILLSAGDLSKDFEELTVLDSPVFWTRVADLFLQMRDPPRTAEPAANKVVWRKRLSDLLCAACAVQEETGLLHQIMASEKDRNVMAEIGILRKFVVQQKGSMSVRERTDWYREFVTQKLDQYKPAGKKDDGKDHRLLGCAMFLFDLWTWSPDDTDGKQLQQSMFRLRILLKDAVQLAIQLSVPGKRAIKKQKIAMAHLLVDVAFHIPRAIAGQ